MSVHLSGNQYYPTMSRMLQDFGVFRNPLELKALAQEITGNAGSAIPYKDFAMVVLGRRSTMSVPNATEEGEKPPEPRPIYPGGKVLPDPQSVKP
uniref:Uncharacterized protein n=1 Tax=Pelusios castaneus TaxID=367368 RepID=A0A8C8S6E2_9SAUR